MKIPQSFRLRSSILVAALLGGLGFGTHAAAQERTYLIDLDSRTITPLGSLGGGNTYAASLNDAGQVVGSSPTSDSYSGHAFITDPMGRACVTLGL